MKKKRVVLFAALAALLCAAPLTVKASDHVDGPQASMNPAADIADLYSWMSATSAKMYMVMDIGKNVGKSALFDPTVQYVFHTKSYDKFGGTPGPAISLLCKFASNTSVSCWLYTPGSPATVIDYVTGDPSNSAMPLVSASGNLKIFAGARQDPFFFNEAGFVNVATIVHAAAGTLTFDAAGCPTLPMMLATALVGQLSHGIPAMPPATPTPDDTDPPVDTFAMQDTLSIVAVVNKTIITPGGPVVALWGSTNM